MKMKQLNLEFSVPKSKILGKLLLIPIMLLFVVSLVFAVSHNTMTWVVPSSAGTSTTFDIAYTISEDTEIPWGLSLIAEVISGGCTFSDGSTTLEDVLLSDDYPGKTYTLTVTTPSSADSCILNSNYKFDIDIIRDLPAKTVTISAPSGNGGGGGGGGGGGRATAPSIYCYVIENNICYGEGLVTCFGLSSDEQYTTLSGCEDNLIPEEEEKETNWSIILLIGGIGGAAYFYFKDK